MFVPKGKWLHGNCFQGWEQYGLLHSCLHPFLSTTMLTSRVNKFYQVVVQFLIFKADKKVDKKMEKVNQFRNNR